MVEIPDTGPEPEDWGAHKPVPVRPEETYRGFQRQVQLRGERLYQRKIQRMKELGLIESNPGLETGLTRIAGASPNSIWETIWSSLTDLVNWIIENPETVDSILETLVQFGIITVPEKEGMGGLTKEQVATMIEAKLGAAPTWEKYLPWLIGGGLGVGLLAVLLRRPAPVYVAGK